jgi:hypothetical protein
MTDFDLDRLGDVWRQEPDPEEIAALQRRAVKVRRSARFAQLADLTLAAIVSIVVLVLAIANPKLNTVLLGAAAIALMLYSSIRQRQLRRLELLGLTGTAEEMLDQSIARLQAKIKRVLLSLVFAGPGLLIGAAFGLALRDGGDGDLVTALSNLFLADRTRDAIVILVAFALIVLHLLQSLRHNKLELLRLRALRDAYRQEDGSI